MKHSHHNTLDEDVELINHVRLILHHGYALLDAKIKSRPGLAEQLDLPLEPTAKKVNGNTGTRESLF